MKKSKGKQRKRSLRRIPFGAWIVIGDVVAVLAIGITVSPNDAFAAYIEPATDETYTLGKSVFAESCATCHGPSGEGNAFGFR